VVVCAGCSWPYPPGLDSRLLLALPEGGQRALEELQQGRREKASLEAESNGKVGLLGLLAHKLMGNGGVEDKNIARNVTSCLGNMLTSSKARRVGTRPPL
jgi:hypothetical protein